MCRSPQETSDGSRKITAIPLGQPTAVLRQGPHPGLLPSVMVQERNLLEEPVDQASISSPVYSVGTGSLNLKALCFL